MRNGRGDHFTKLLKRRILQLHRISKVCQLEGSFVSGLVYGQNAKELELILALYKEWKKMK